MQVTSALRGCQRHSSQLWARRLSLTSIPVVYKKIHLDSTGSLEVRFRHLKQAILLRRTGSTSWPSALAAAAGSDESLCWRCVFVAYRACGLGRRRARPSSWSKPGGYLTRLPAACASAPWWWSAATRLIRFLTEACLRSPA